MNRTILIATLLSALAATTTFALEPVNTDRTGAAIKGYDPVAYFVAGEAVKGNPDITYEWNGAVWHFASDGHRTMFKASPEHFAPKYGGYCAWAVSQNSTADIDPSAWRIVDGELYLNYSKKIQKRWEADIPGNVAAADRNWPELLGN